VNEQVRRLVEALGLAPHPEGGWYRETWRSAVKGSSARPASGSARPVRVSMPATTKPKPAACQAGRSITDSAHCQRASSSSSR